VIIIGADYHPGFQRGVRSSNHDRGCDRRDAWVGLSSWPESDYEASPGWQGKTFNESEMARSSECTG
jgi:hypothetical protein